MPDAIVIGGGVIGLLSARELRRRGLDVTLVERDRPGRQASWASAGILSTADRHHPGQDSVLKRRSEELYPSLVADLKEETDIDPEMTYNGHVIPAFSDQQADEFRAEARGDPDAEVVEGAALREAEPSLGPNIVAGLLRPGGQIDNRRLCRALEIAVRRAGVNLVYGASVTEILREGNKVVGVRTLEGDVLAPVVVNAAGSWSRQIPGCDPVIPVVPQRGEILALDQSAVGLRRVVTKVPDPYLVPRADGRLIVGATRKYTGFNAAFTAGGVNWLLSRGDRDDPGPRRGADRRDLDRLSAELTGRIAVDRAGRCGRIVLCHGSRTERDRAGPRQRRAASRSRHWRLAEGSDCAIRSAPLRRRRDAGSEHLGCPWRPPDLRPLL